MTPRLNGKKVAILVADGFEQEELTSPREALQNAGAQSFIVSPNDKRVRGWKDGQWGDSFDVNVHLDRADPEQFDALVLPGGVMNPDKLRANDRAVKFVRAFFEQKKPVAAICHGPWTLIDADVTNGRRMTSYHSIRKDLMNAGAKWVDEPVVVDHGLVTSRHPGDLEQFNAKMVEEISEGRHASQHA